MMTNNLTQRKTRRVWEAISASNLTKHEQYCSETENQQAITNKRFQKYYVRWSNRLPLTVKQRARWHLLGELALHEEAEREPPMSVCWNRKSDTLISAAYIKLRSAVFEGITHDIAMRMIKETRIPVRPSSTDTALNRQGFTDQGDSPLRQNYITKREN